MKVIYKISCFSPHVDESLGLKKFLFQGRIMSFVASNPPTAKLNICLKSCVDVVLVVTFSLGF